MSTNTEEIHSASFQTLVFCLLLTEISHYNQQGAEMMDAEQYLFDSLGDYNGNWEHLPEPRPELDT